MREGAMVADSGYFGMASSDALTISVIFGLLLLVTSIPGGVIWVVTGERGAAPFGEPTTGAYQQ